MSLVTATYVSLGWDFAWGEAEQTSDMQVKCGLSW